MMRKSFLVAFVALVACVAHAQYIGNVGLQTTQQTVATSTACTGSAQTFAVNNLGQTQHYLSVNTGTQPTMFQAEIDGIDKAGNVYRISDIIENAFSAVIGQGLSTVTASGYFPKIQIKVTCSPNTATFTASYSGSQVTFNQNAGTYLGAQIDKVNFGGPAGNVNQQDTINTPFGSTAGTIYFQYSGAVAGGSLSINCTTNQFNPNNVLNVPLANVNTLQIFQIPNVDCPSVTVQYTSGGSATSVTGEYVFSVPGRTTNATQYLHVTGTTATAAKPIPGFLHTVSINTGAAGTVSIFDLATGACTGTPSTNTVAVITATTSTLETLIYDVNMLNGICVKASAGMDFTVSYQ